MLALIGVRNGDCNYFTFSMETNVNNMHNPPTNMDNIFCPAENSFYVLQKSQKSQKFCKILNIIV